MKRSDYIAQRTAHWVALWGRQESNPMIAQLVRNDVEAVEAAGKVWDEEEPDDEPQLPAHLGLLVEMVDSSSFAHMIDAVDEWWVVAAVPATWQRPTNRLAKRRVSTLRAMVDAYNDWGIPHGVKRQQLLALLMDQPSYAAKRIRELLGVVQSD